MKEKKDRVDDALHATRAAIDEGIVLGGGAALLKSRTKFLKQLELSSTNKFNGDKDEQLGAEILLNAIEKPFIQILLNAGIDKYHNILDKVSNEVWSSNISYNIKTGDYIDFIKEGIIDPTKVTRTALENAVSVAGTMLITECAIVDDPDKKDEASMPPMMGM